MKTLRLLLLAMGVISIRYLFISSVLVFLISSCYVETKLKERKKEWKKCKMCCESKCLKKCLVSRVWLGEIGWIGYLNFHSNGAYVGQEVGREKFMGTWSLDSNEITLDGWDGYTSVRYGNANGTMSNGCELVIVKEGFYYGFYAREPI